MKKIMSLLLALLMLAAAFTGCGKEEGKGAVIPVYISDEIVNFDPAFAYDNEASMKILPMLYEGLTVINEKGKVENALLDDYTYEQQEDGTYVMEVTLEESYWSDGITVSASDFVYAFKRIMDPEFDSSAAVLLYDLQNAKEVKAGTVSIDDLGVRAAEKTVIQFIFDEDIDVDLWLETLASPMLVPLRESAVTTQTPQVQIIDEEGMIVQHDVPVYAWSTDPSILVTNGKFCVKKMVPSTSKSDGEMVLERNAYYRRDPMGDSALDKHVKTYQLKVVFPCKNTQEQYELEANEKSVSLKQFTAYAAFNAEERADKIVFDSDISMVKDPQRVESVDMLSQHAYYFNTNNELFKDARVRKALSMAIDRQAITELVAYTEVSGGLVADGVFADTKRKDTYREKFGSLIESGANESEAKSLLKQAGVTSGKFSISCRNSDVDIAIAEYVAEVWEGLGFDVSVKKLGINNSGIDGTKEVDEYQLQRDLHSNALIYGDFDVIAIDVNAMTTYAFSALAPYATGYTGRAIDQRLVNTDPDYNANIPHVTGWQNDEFDALIDKAYAEKDVAARSTILFDAEKILMDQMPVMPLVSYTNAYSQGKDLGGLEANYYGTVLFDQASLKHADDYTPVESTEATE